MAGEASELRAGKFKRRRRKNPQWSCVAGTLGAGRGRSSPLIPTPGRFPPDPRGRSTCRASRGAGAARERTRSPHPRALPPTRARSHPRSLLIHFKVHSQNSQTFSAQRGFARERRREPLPSPSSPQGLRAWCPPRIANCIDFSRRPAVELRGVGEGGLVWGGEAARRGVG